MASDIQRVERTELARQDSSVLDMMKQVIERENPVDTAGALEQLVKLKEHMEDRDARREFFQAFARVQARLQTVVATMPVPDKNGNIRWYVALFPDVLDAIEPVLREEGFSLRFDSTREGSILTAYCYAMHTAGHQESARCHFNAASAPGGDLGALTSAKRGALMEMFALKVRRSDDARLLGDFIDPQDLDDLERMLKAAAPVDMAKFLAFAGAAKLTDIRKGKMPPLTAFLRKRIAAKGTVPNPRAQDGPGTTISEPADTDTHPQTTPANSLAQARMDLGGAVAQYILTRKAAGNVGTPLSADALIKAAAAVELPGAKGFKTVEDMAKVGAAILAGKYDIECGDKLP